MLNDRQVEVIQALRKARLFSAGVVGKALYMHHNSVKYHISNIKKKTGHDPQTYDGMRALLEMMEVQHGQ